MKTITTLKLSFTTLAFALPLIIRADDTPMMAPSSGSMMTTNAPRMMMQTNSMNTMASPHMNGMAPDMMAPNKMAAGHDMASGGMGTNRSSSMMTPSSHSMTMAMSHQPSMMPTNSMNTMARPQMMTPTNSMAQPQM